MIKQNKLKVCTLSGTSEIGRNCSFIEYNDQILIVDMGFSFPDQTLYGIDYLIPNYSYLKQNKKKIKAILITHGHLDHIGGLPYTLPELGYPKIYAGNYAAALVREKLKEHRMDKKVKIIGTRRKQEVQMGQFHVKFIGVTHSIPHAFSIFVNSPEGGVFFSGDYKIDRTPVGEEESDYQLLKDLRGKVDLALVESTYPSTEGQSTSESVVAQNLETAIKNWKGRIVVSAFSSQVARLYSLIEIAKKTKRKIAFSGYSLRKAIKIAQELGYIKPPKNIIINEREIHKYPDHEILFVCTGSQGEKRAALNRISLGTHKYFKIKKGDLIMLSSSEIPGNIIEIEKMTDRLIEKGAELVNSAMADIHASGHGTNDDQKIMLKLIQPKNILPIHGNLTKRYQMMQNYVRWGVKKRNILLTSDGQFWEKSGSEWKRGSQIPSRPILIDGLGVGDIGDYVIKDRAQLAEYGVVFVELNLSAKTGKIVGKPRFISRGFVYEKRSKELFDALEKIVKDKHNHWLKKNRSGKRDTKALRKTLEDAMSKYIYKKTERDPVILISVF
ncbi:RNase J family beta-CASP ribonuclease [Candidatus Dojkabacteria bacterium]|nr:RNase J family beta-CASP ribonuclease [Candidatus Dojkabacteria bacterium]